jgi:hypothetical protein
MNCDRIREEATRNQGGRREAAAGSPKGAEPDATRNRVIAPDWEPPPSATGSVRCRNLLGGLLRHYYREAA